MAGDERVYRLEGFAVPAELDRVHELIERVGAEELRLDSTDLMLFEMAVVEIANNVVEHGRPAGEVRWQLILTVTAEAITADLYDSGEVVSLDFARAMPEEDAESGRGIPLAKSLLDEISVGPSDSGSGNHWRLLRRLGASDAE
ncbi:ATP-binding protein [Salinibacterium sp. SYSU T00001]|uniref:ATP-binding protein n=1 Tax=Homoserinimonas sedimenticola TaxID=2986805 RepID=UPI00223553BE|nr:ATP-binding protein [Salinibacterium sedimenticola]MCW4386099.1 ATP-binding protein [Salinibacterium sedimenticola]